ncbi:MAG: alpha/beta hydrolase [Chloroflexota bacterium]
MTESTLLFDQVEDGYADNGGVKIHYVTIGSGPLLVMIHGFPEFWYSWRNQMPALAEQFRVVAVDLRGYNLSDKPIGVEQYSMRHLVSDIVAVIEHLGEKEAVIVGHDWGGMVSWALAMFRPDLVERLIICNLPHPNGLGRELAHNPAQQKNSQYARNFQQEGSHDKLTAEGLAEWISDGEAKPHYLAAYERSDFEAMLNYYKANYPREPYIEPDPTTTTKVQCPVLMIHGLEDWALLPGALNNTWEWLEKDLTLITVPGAGHFVQQDAAEFVTKSMLMWLNR